MIAGSKRGLTATMKRELKRRSAIEATIGHMKTDGRLDRNFLLGHVGDAINALLVVAGHKSAPHPRYAGALACPRLGSSRCFSRETGYFRPSPRPFCVDGLAIIQGRPSGRHGKWLRGQLIVAWTSRRQSTSLYLRLLFESLGTPPTALFGATLRVVAKSPL
jgi:hypothetical protein